MTKKRRKKRIRYDRILLLVGIAVFFFSMLFRFFSNSFSSPTIPQNIEETEEDLRTLHSYNWQFLSSENGVFSYEDGTYHGVIGMDVSYAQKDINWQKVKQDPDIQFVMIRVGYRGYETGLLHEDTHFQTNIQGARSIDLPVGIYFFSHAISLEEAREDAQFVLERIQDYEITCPVVFDMEYVSDNDRIQSLTKQEKTMIAKEFCRIIQEAGYEAMVYGSEYWLKEEIDVVELQEDYEFWLASYTSKTPNYPYQFTIWQFTEKGRIPGISEPVDLNLWFQKS